MASPVTAALSARQPATRGNLGVLSPVIDALMRPYTPEEQAQLASYTADPSWVDQAQQLEAARRQGVPHDQLMQMASGLLGGFGGTFAGVKAATAPLGALREAEALAAKGVGERDIWGQTGWFKGADGQWRHEISDQAAKLDLYPLAAQKAGIKEWVFAPEAVKHSALYEAYPGLEKVAVQTDVPKGMGGIYSPAVTAGNPTVGLASAPTAEMRGTALHELQHAAQDIEGFEGGSTPDSMAAAISKAHLARQALNFRREMAALPKGMDLSAKENAVIEQYQKAGAMDWVPPREARDLAHQPSVSDADLARQASILGDRVSISPMEAYHNLAGEAEARAVQARADMTPEQRRATFPFDSYDVPRDQLIVRALAGRQP